MKERAYTGISFPFRITSRGGVAISTTSANNPAHIVEGIRQILNTEFLERVMEGGEFYSKVSTLLFEPNDISLQLVLKKYIVEDLERLEKRIELDEHDIEFSVETENDFNFLYANITFRVLKYDTVHSAKIKLGEV